MTDLTPEQIRAGTRQIMTHAERQAFLMNSGIGKRLGFPQAELETVDDDIAAGSHHVMSYQERYEFVKNRKYSKIKNQGTLGHD